MSLFAHVPTPLFRSPEEAAAYVRTLQSLLRALGSSDGNMEDVCLYSTSPESHAHRSLPGLPPLRR
jgi:hypothetical protein